MSPHSGAVYARLPKSRAGRGLDNALLGPRSLRLPGVPIADTNPRHPA